MNIYGAASGCPAPGRAFPPATAYCPEKCHRLEFCDTSPYALVFRDELKYFSEIRDRSQRAGQQAVSLQSDAADFVVPPQSRQVAGNVDKIPVGTTSLDQLLDAAEQSIRQSSGTAAELALDQHLSAVATLTCNWTISSARDPAWNNARLLWGSAR